MHKFMLRSVQAAALRERSNNLRHYFGECMGLLQKLKLQPGNETQVAMNQKDPSGEVYFPFCKQIFLQMFRKIIFSLPAALDVGITD